MIKIQDLRLPAGAEEEEIRDLAASFLHVKKEDIRGISIRKRSIDARKKPDISFVYTVAADVRHEKEVLRRIRNRKIGKEERTVYHFPAIVPADPERRPVICGSGPAGLFCALLLAESGFRPVILERGGRVEERGAAVDTFFETGVLDPESNVQFGEGGAGTFSDGKLNTMTHDPLGRGTFVLEQFVRFGAPREILYDAKPHIGTDVLRGILVRMRKAIEEAGGTFLFRSRLTDLVIQNGALTGVRYGRGDVIDTDTLVLAIGHSARDTFRMLCERGLLMTPKAFAVGLRVQHPQSMIDVSQYGRERGDDLPPSSYKLTAHDQAGRGVYTFCMCPGGYVVNASSAPGLLAVNGMSYADRAGENANSAVIVTVGPDDYRKTVSRDDVLAGVCYQEMLEKKAFLLADGKIPLQKWEDFKKDRASVSPGDVMPCVKGAWEMTSLCGLLGETLEETFRTGIEAFGRKIEGFDRPDMLLAGIESRTSSPVRMLRNEQMEASLRGVFPCGEGAGYAGGITSAAVDGIRVAEAVARRLGLQNV